MIKKRTTKVNDIKNQQDLSNDQTSSYLSMNQQQINNNKINNQQEVNIDQQNYNHQQPSYNSLNNGNINKNPNVKSKFDINNGIVIPKTTPHNEITIQDSNAISEITKNNLFSPEVQSLLTEKKKNQTSFFWILGTFIFIFIAVASILGFVYYQKSHKQIIPPNNISYDMTSGIFDTNYAINKLYSAHGEVEPLTTYNVGDDIDSFKSEISVAVLDILTEVIIDSDNSGQTLDEDSFFLNWNDVYFPPASDSGNYNIKISPIKNYEDGEPVYVQSNISLLSGTGIIYITINN